MASDAEPLEALSQDQAARYPLLAELMSRSARFPVPFPVQAVRCCQLLQRRAAPPQQLSAFIESACPLLHESVVRLYAGFLRHKARHGTASERELYRGMTVTASSQSGPSPFTDPGTRLRCWTEHAALAGPAAPARTPCSSACPTTRSSSLRSSPSAPTACSSTAGPGGTRACRRRPATQSSRAES